MNSAEHQAERDAVARPRIGELFAGYGGLGMGVQAVLGGEVAWYSDVCKFDKDGNAGHYEPHRGACAILAHRFPGVPNLGDVTKVDWSTVDPVDILTGGSPCQDLSHAGRRAGMTEGTRSNLWVAMREAIAQLRPSIVVWENVRGAYSAAADSAVEPCPGCVGDGSGVASLRALGRVLGDLSDLGYDARWHGLPASEVGAPHGRMRVFVVATNAERPGWGAARDAASGQEARGWAPTVAGGSGGVATDRALNLLPTPAAMDTAGAQVDRRAENGFGPALRDVPFLLPTPVTAYSQRSPEEWRAGRPAGNGAEREAIGDLEIVAKLLPTPAALDGIKAPEQYAGGNPSLPGAVKALLPTPAVNDMGEGKTVERWDEWTADMQAKHGNGNGHGKSLAIEAQRLLPTPGAVDGVGGPKRLREDGRTEADHGPALRDLAAADRWGDYAGAIGRWEHALGREAPEPTQPSSKGTPQLAPAFVEWMMGLPAGWVTGVPGLSRNEALKALGNGVVPQQAASALHEMLSWEVAA